MDYLDECGTHPIKQTYQELSQWTTDREGTNGNLLHWSKTYGLSTDSQYRKSRKQMDKKRHPETNRSVEGTGWNLPE